MSNLFDSLLLDLEKPFRVILKSAKSKGDLIDTEGVKASIDVYSKDSEHAKKYKRPDNFDSLSDAQKASDYLAYLTAAWYLVGFDQKPIDYPYSRENAREFYSNPGAVDIFQQAWDGAFERGNFVPASSSS